MSSQLDLEWNGEQRHRVWWVRILDVIRELTHVASLKEVAYRLGVAPAALAHALAERDRHYPRMDWLPVLLEMAAEFCMADKLARAIVGPAQLDVVAKQPLTPEQKLAKLTKLVASLGPLGSKMLDEVGE
jgi:hypothetical protein